MRTNENVDVITSVREVDIRQLSLSLDKILNLKSKKKNNVIGPQLMERNILLGKSYYYEYH